MITVIALLRTIRVYSAIFTARNLAGCLRKPKLPSGGADQCPALAPTRTEAVCLDVTNELAVNAVISGVVEQYSRLDIAVNNAGVNTLTHRATVDRCPKDEWDRSLEVDLTGLYLVSKAAAAVLLHQGSGQIINIESVMGSFPQGCSVLLPPPKQVC